MNTQEHNATLANVEFNPDTLHFDGFNVSGILEADDEVRSTYFTNTISDATKAEQAFVQSQDLPVGVLMLNPAETEYSPTEFGIEGSWGEALSRHGDTGAANEAMSFSLVSLDDEEAAAALQVSVKLVQQNEGRNLTLSFQLGNMMVKPEYEGRGHKLDLAAGICWMAQDITTCICLAAAPDAQIKVSVETLDASDENVDFGTALVMTLEGVREAMEEELGNAERFAPVEFSAASLEAA